MKIQKITQWHILPIQKTCRIYYVVGSPARANCCLETYKYTLMTQTSRRRTNTPTLTMITLDYTGIGMLHRSYPVALQKRVICDLRDQRLRLSYLLIVPHQIHNLLSDWEMKPMLKKRLDFLTSVGNDYFLTTLQRTSSSHSIRRH